MSAIPCGELRPFPGGGRLCGMTKFGLVVPTYQPILDAGRTVPELVATAVEAERLGLDSVWVGDTLARAPIDALMILSGFAARSEPEFDFVGVPWARRRARLDDIVALWRAIWSGASSFQGEVLHYDSLPSFPAPARPGGPPVWLAAFTPGALERVGRRYDGWLPYPPNPA